MPMTRLTAIFENPDKAQCALNALLEKGIKRESINLVMRDIVSEQNLDFEPRFNMKDEFYFELLGTGLNNEEAKGFEEDIQKGCAVLGVELDSVYKKFIMDLCNENNAVVL